MRFFAETGRQDLTLFKDSRSNLSGPTLSPIHGRSPRNLPDFHFRSDVLQLLVGGLYDGHACDARGRPRPDGIAEVVVSALGFAIYLWSSLTLITMGRVSPDLLMAGFLYLAVALLLQIWEKPEQLWRYFGIGAVLGIGYLAKSPVFPLALVLFAILWVLVGTWHRALPRVLMAVLVFAAIAGPLVLVISRIKGRFTFGNSARINYIVRLDGASPGWYFQNLGTAGGRYTLTARRAFDSPPVYERDPDWRDHTDMV